MKIALVSQSCDNRTGIGRIVNALALEFVGLGHDVSIAAQTLEGIDGRVIKRHVLSLTSSKGLNKILFRFFGPRFSRREADVMHTFGVGRRADVVSAQSCHRAGLELVGTKQSRVVERRSLGVYDRVSLADEQVLLTSQSTRRIVAVSQLVKSQIEQYYGVDGRNISVIPNGVNIRLFEGLRDRTCRSDVRSSVGFTQDHFVLLFVGNEFGRKGLGVLLRAMSALGDQRVRLLVVGGGDQKRYAKLAGHLGVAQRVRFLGSVSAPESLYLAADSFVLPSLYEPFGIVILEAMAAGVPVITSKLCGATEEMQHRRHVLHLEDPTSVEELSEAIRLLIRDESVRKMLADAGREKAKEYSWERIAQEMLGVYNWVRA
jgi:UDP-glucose:(heptosyl)LPS alpha-1,3-glucosyltransferase